MPVQRARPPMGSVEAQLAQLSLILDERQASPLGIAGAVQVTADLVTGDNRLRHGMRKASGVIVIKRSAVADLYDVDDEDPEYWVINASANVTATLVFVP